MDGTDLYALLGVAPDADQAALKAAYSLRSRAGKVSAELDGAYRSLIDPAIRSRYDRSRVSMRPLVVPAESQWALRPKSSEPDVAEAERTGGPPQPTEARPVVAGANPDTSATGRRGASEIRPQEYAQGDAEPQFVPPMPSGPQLVAATSSSGPHVATLPSERRWWRSALPILAVVLVTGVTVAAGVALWLNIRGSATPDAEASSMEAAAPTVAPVAATATAVPPNPAHLRTYVVEPGDGYIAISRRFAVDMDEMLAMNSISLNTPLYPGTTLRLPSYRTYVVQPGDGYIAIAQTLGVDLDLLLRINQRALQSALHPGDVLELP